MEDVAKRFIPAASWFIVFGMSTHDLIYHVNPDFIDLERWRALLPHPVKSVEGNVLT